MRQLLSLMALAALTCGAAYANCGDDDCGKGKCEKASKAECKKKASSGKDCQKAGECVKGKEQASKETGNKPVTN